MIHPGDSVKVAPGAPLGGMTGTVLRLFEVEGETRGHRMAWVVCELPGATVAGAVPVDKLTKNKGNQKYETEKD